MTRSLLFLAFLASLLFVPSSDAQEVASLKTGLAEKEQTYQLFQAQEDLARLEGERRIAETTQEASRQRLDLAKQQLLQKQQFMLTNPNTSIEAERQAYASALRATEEGEHRLARLKQRVAQVRRDLEAIKAKLDGIAAEREALQRALGNARLERLRQQIEREQEIVVRGEVGCADETIRQCQRRALERTRQRAAEEGSAVLVDAMTTVQNLQVIRDEIRTRVKALVLRQEVLDEGFIGRSGYFYQIRAVVKGQISPELRRHLLGGAQTSPSPPVIPPPVTRRYKLIVNVTPADSLTKIMNIQPAYVPGMALAPGQYDLLVQRDGYEAVRRWVTIRDADVTFDIRLQKVMHEQLADQQPIAKSPEGVAHPDGASQPPTQVARLELETKKPGKTIGRFIKYDNRTALDTKTNLMWMTQDFRNIEGRAPNDWIEARAWAAKMNQQHYGGYDDWRVPTAVAYQGSK